MTIPPCPTCNGRLIPRIRTGGGYWDSNDCPKCKTRWANDPPRSIEDLREENTNAQP